MNTEMNKMNTEKTTGLDLASVRRILDVVDAGLTIGVGRPQPGRMCVQAAVCYALGEPHGDKPQCVAQAVRLLAISLNDAVWSSPQARAAGMRRLAIAQLGTAGTIDEGEFARILADLTIRQILPIALRTVGLEEEAVRCEQEGTLEAALAAKEAAVYVAPAGGAVYAVGAAIDAADKAAYSEAPYAVAAVVRAGDAAKAVVADAAKAAGDAVLCLMADISVTALRRVGAPGIRWMDLLS